MARSPAIRWSTVLAMVGTAACAGNPAPLRPIAPDAPHIVNLCETPSACRDTIDIGFLGVGGFTFAERGEAPLVATAPFFTRVPRWRLLPFVSVRADTSRIRRGIDTLSVAALRAVLVGHAHYDHLLDVPHFVDRWAPRARVLASPTAHHLFASGRPAGYANPVDTVNAFVGTRDRVGRWIPIAGGRWRVMPVVSSHAPNVMRYRFNPGSLDKPYKRPPRTAHDWKRGPTYAWIIDHLDTQGRPDFRVFYQDAAARPRFNALPPFTGDDVRRVDVAIISVGNWNLAPEYPRVLLDSLQPRYVLAGHWEDFFKYPKGELKAVPLGAVDDLAKLLDARLGRDGWGTPSPRGVLRFAYDAR